MPRFGPVRRQRPEGGRGSSCSGTEVWGNSGEAHSGMCMLVVLTSSLSCFTCPARVHAPNSLCKSSPLDSHFEQLYPPAPRQTVMQMGGIAVEVVGGTML